MNTNLFFMSRIKYPLALAAMLLWTAFAFHQSLDGSFLLGEPLLHWDWESIPHDWNALETEFKLLHTSGHIPADFQWGVADSAYQTEGAALDNSTMTTNNWTRWENDPKALPASKSETDPLVKIQAGNGIDRWNRYKEDIDRMVAAGFDTYRLSVEWSKIEPVRGVFDLNVLNHYRDLVAYAKEKGLRVMVCLWHFTFPCWFEDKGAFEQHENIADFVNFCTKVAEHLKDHVAAWIPFNEPDAFAMAGYAVGDLPPGKKNWHNAGKMVAHMLEAHVDVSKAIKKINPQAQIGFVKVVVPMDPFHYWYPLERIICSLVDQVVNQSFFDFFKNGTFTWRGLIPAPMNVSYTNLDAPKSIDFFGVNYYSHVNIAINFPFLPFQTDKACHPWQERNDIKQIIYPEGLYRAIVRCSQIGKPLIVTENGTSDNTFDGPIRDKYIRKHLYAVTRALSEGYDVRGYHYWSFMDNFEWCHGYERCYGLYHVDRVTMERTLRANAADFVNFVKGQKNAWG